MKLIIETVISLLLVQISPCLAQKSDPAINQSLKLKTELENGTSEISNYNSACYFALAGEEKLAFQYLHSAISNDKFNDVQTLLNDSDLLSLHKNPQWTDIVNGVTENANMRRKTDSLFFNQDQFWESKAFKTAYRENLSDDEKIAGLSKFWSEVKYNFVNFDLIPDLNFDSLYISYISKVLLTKSIKEYYRTMSEFCAYLNDAHTNIYMPKELEEEEYSRPLLRTRLIEDKIVIVSVQDSILHANGVNVGQEVIKVDGLPVKEYAKKYVAPYVCASTKQDRDVRLFDYTLLAGSSKQAINLVLRDSEGKHVEHKVSRVLPSTRNAKMKKPNFAFKILEGNIAYVALNSFGSDEALKEFEKKFDEIAQSKAIIFDVRDNGGGNSSVGWNILKYLIKQPAKIHRWHTRVYNASFRAWGMKQNLYVANSTLFPQEGKHYDKPVVVLISARSFSAAEDFAGAFKSLARGTIIGEATGGSSGMPLMISLPGNGWGRICTKRDMLAGGKEFIGIGIQPDIIVSPTWVDINNGKDTVLEAALKSVNR